MPYGLILHDPGRNAAPGQKSWGLDLDSLCRALWNWPERTAPSALDEHAEVGVE